jgi:radical SAM protein with 4Fe4S-binding SPASM domain
MFSVINKLCLTLTTACNMNCEYCHQSSYRKSMPVFFDDYDNLEKFIRTLPLTPTVQFRILGGEISTFPQEWQYAMDRIRRIEKKEEVKFIFSVPTNGSGVDNILNLIDQGYLSGNGVTISWDGIHSASKSRKPKAPEHDDKFFNDVIMKFSSTPYHDEFSVVYAITPHTVDDLYESLVYCLDNGIRKFNTYFVHEANYDSMEFVSRYKQQLTLVAQEFVDRYPYLDKRWIYHDWNVIKYRKKHPINVARLTKCPNLGKVLHINTSGDVYPCVYFSDHNAYQLGNIVGGLSKGPLERFIAEYFKSPICNYGNCSNVQCFECPGSNLVHNGDMNKRFMNTCSLRSIEMDVFNQYFPKLDITPLDEKFFWQSQEDDKIADAIEMLPNRCKLPLVESYVNNSNPTLSENLHYVRGWL